MRRKDSSPIHEARDALLRSINVAFDAEHPGRVGHFRPTSKSVPVLRALLGQAAQRAILVTAPYGSGKSLVATYALQVVENVAEARPVHDIVTGRLKTISAELAASIRTRAKRRSNRGIVLPLHGAQQDLSKSMAEAANASFRRSRRGQGGGRPYSVQPEADPLATLRAVMDAASRGEFDSVLVVWDEFGRHLEQLLAAGRAVELSQLQTMAEIAARSKGVPLTLALLTHRGLSQYAQAAPQAIRLEWAKVEGRFESIQYIDDSKEMYRLIATTVSDRRPAGPNGPQKKWVHRVGKAIRGLGIFRELTASATQELVEAAYPMHPVALYALPRVSARISQNERTIFSFLSEANLGRPVTLAHVYDYFADSMRADTSAGGAHRQYLETETALRRTSSAEDAETLKAACLLGLGLAGERGHVSRALLAEAIARPDSTAASDGIIKELVDKKLLLYRPHSGDVSVWHGADVDLRGVLENEKERQRSGFNALGFLKRELPAPIWRPVEFNDDYHIKRFFAGRYVTPAQFAALCDSPQTASQGWDGADGVIFFVLAETAADQARVRQRAETSDLRPGVVVAIPARELSITEAALEVACLEQMLRDPELVAKDPLVELELRHLLDDARGYLHRAVDQMVTPQSIGPIFWHGKLSLTPKSAAELRGFLSAVVREIYPNTPKINNELINRRRVSTPVANARKKLEMAILERTGVEGLGIQGNFPDASIFRTVLLNTGLYRTDSSGTWGFAEPEELRDPGLRHVWTAFKEFFQSPSDGAGKGFADLLNHLARPPIGLRAGVVPVLISCAFRAFPAAISLRREGTYVDDVMPTIVEELCKHPDLYALDVLKLSKDQAMRLAAIQAVFGDCDPGVTRQRDQIRRAFDCLRNWVTGLPPVARLTRDLSQRALNFREAVAEQTDPVQFLCQDLSRLLAEVDWDGLEDNLKQARNEVEGVLPSVRVRAGEAVRRTLDVGLSRREASLADVCQRWTKCFSVPDLMKAGGSQAVSFISRLEQRYDSDDLLLDSIASQLVGNPTNRWDDESLSRFERALTEAVRAVEDEAVRLAVDGPANPVIVNNLSRLIEARLRNLYENLASLTGEDRAREALLHLAIIDKGKTADGNHSRRAR
jgi:hypothetical protein